MKNAQQERLPKVPLTALATLCFVTLIMCQTRFKISKEMNRESCYDPPVKRSKDCWFLYTIGNPDSFKCVLRVFVVITSPMLSLISTALLLFGKMESNPYFFIPWLFLTIKGLLLIQTDNLITILRDMSARANYALGFRIEDLKWILFYITIFMIDLVETFSFCEIFDLFLVLWNHHPKYNLHIANIEAVKKDIADIMKSLSKCSLGSLSKMSLGSTSESDGTNDTIAKELESIEKFSVKEEDKLAVDPREPNEIRSKVPKDDFLPQTELEQNLLKDSAEEEFRIGNQLKSLKPKSENDANSTRGYDKILKVKDGELIGFDASDAPKIKLKTTSALEVKQEIKKADLYPGLLNKKDFSTETPSA